MTLAEVKARIQRENTMFEITSETQEDVIRLALINLIERLRMPMISASVNSVSDQTEYTVPATIRADKIICVKRA